jgi:hypothetical protein
MRNEHIKTNGIPENNEEGESGRNIEIMVTVYRPEISL